MGFIDSYKHLEKLCGEVLNDDRRISAYIDEMLRTPRGSHYVSTWDKDLKNLKHYRWVRNQISHEPGCTEQNMCEPEDELWLDEFYSRIMNQTDPLSLYHRATRPRPVSKPVARPIQSTPTYTQPSNYRKSARIDYIDLFRSVGIIFMVMGHIGFGDVFYYFIHAFHMPMFFWISGYLFKHRTKEEMSFGAFVLKKVKTLLVPYFAFGAFHCLFDTVWRYGFNEPVEIQSMLNLVWFNTHKLPICGALWFLTSLFFADILFFLIDRYIANKPLKVLVISLLAVMGCLLNSAFSVTLPFALGTSFVGVGLYYIGHLFRKYGEQKIICKVMNLSWVPAILLGIVSVVLIFVNDEINMRKEVYGFIPLFWINAVLCVVVGMNLSKLIYKFIQGNIIGKWLTGIGKNSIVYVCLNQVVILVCDKLIKMVDMPLIVSQSLILIVSLVVLWVLSIIFMKTKLKVLVGRK